MWQDGASQFHGDRSSLLRTLPNFTLYISSSDGSLCPFYNKLLNVRKCFWVLWASLVNYGTPGRVPAIQSKVPQKISNLWLASEVGAVLWVWALNLWCVMPSPGREGSWIVQHPGGITELPAVGGRKKSSHLVSEMLCVWVKEKHRSVLATHCVST